jgi:excisionase family DNA binding protein
MARDFLTLPEAAEIVGCSRRFLEKKIRDGELRAFKPSSRIARIRKVELERWIELRSLGGRSIPEKSAD